MYPIWDQIYFPKLHPFARVSVAIWYFYRSLASNFQLLSFSHKLAKKEHFFFQNLCVHQCMHVIIPLGFRRGLGLSDTDEHMHIRGVFGGEEKRGARVGFGQIPPNMRAIARRIFATAWCQTPPYAVGHTSYRRSRVRSQAMLWITPHTIIRRKKKTQKCIRTVSQWSRVSPHTLSVHATLIYTYIILIGYQMHPFFSLYRYI